MKNVAKVTAKNGNHYLVVSWQGATYQKKYFRKNDATSEAMRIKHDIRMGKHPGVSMQLLGGFELQAV